MEVKERIWNNKKKELNTENVRCQKCLELGHWTFQCKGKRKIPRHISRTTILKKRLKAYEESSQKQLMQVERQKVEKITKTKNKKKSKRKHETSSNSESDSDSDSDSNSSSSSSSKSSVSSDSSSSSSSMSSNSSDSSSSSSSEDSKEEE
ncbi:hypothetical protein RUM44_012645 [Polyplax serrata]|uniref:Zinc finger CCHC domain-containing protein 10 n=1 Tax=Polyplax serrata TaxID=468196 RepID=A0ABR1BG38_POLSC